MEQFVSCVAPAISNAAHLASSQTQILEWAPEDTVHDLKRVIAARQEMATTQKEVAVLLASLVFTHTLLTSTTDVDKNIAAAKQFASKKLDIKVADLQPNLRGQVEKAKASTGDEAAVSSQSGAGQTTPTAPRTAGGPARKKLRRIGAGAA